jgi:hypothetical protein
MQMGICAVVEQALQSGVLSIECEEQLRLLLSQKYDREEFWAFMRLQEAAMTGAIRQESRMGSVSG